HNSANSMPRLLQGRGCGRREEPRPRPDDWDASPIVGSGLLDSGLLDSGLLDSRASETTAGDEATASVGVCGTWAWEWLSLAVFSGFIGPGSSGVQGESFKVQI